MTAPANTTPLSVDYTGRDYYALREELIARVKERTAQQWQGTDENDFGLALIESFAYMGDLLNYYIDRVANESYILTATQRESLINIANMYGYKPANYVSALVDLTMSSSAGYIGQIGAATIEDGTVGAISGHFAKIIVPSDHPFVDGDYLVVQDVPSEVSVVEGDTTVTYNPSVLNGNFPISYVGYSDIGGNVLWYRPSETITNIVPDGTKFTLTLSGSGTMAIGDASPGQMVYVSGVTSDGNGYNGNWVIDSVPTASTDLIPQITIDSAASENTAVIRSAVVQSSNFVYSSWSRLTVGQKVKTTGVKSSGNTGGTDNTGYNFNSATVTAVKDETASIFGLTANGSTVVFDSSVLFAVNDIVSVYGIYSVGNESGTAGLGYNFKDKAVSAVNSLDTAISSVTPDSGLGEILYTTASAHTFQVGDYVTISGVSPDVYNISAARIIDVSSSTFTVQGYWKDAFNAGLSGSAKATSYTFTVASTESGSVISSSASAICRQFTVSGGGRTPGTFSTSVTPLMTPLIGGTETLSASSEVVYSNLPPIIFTGTTLASSAKVLNLGDTTVPQGTQVTAQVNVDGGTKDVIFSTQADVTVPYKGTATVTAIHGEDVSLRTENAANTESIAYDISGELLGYSTGKANQTFAVSEVQVAPRSIRVFVDNGIEWEEWSQVEHVQDYAPYSKVFQVDVAASEIVSVSFGDGVSGLIPNTEGGIKASYIAGGGLIGNVGADTLKTFGIIPASSTEVEQDIRSYITVTNSLNATGGADPETDNSIRYNAPRSLRSLNRAVTLEDFANLALSVDGVAKSNAIADSRSSVTVYVSPVSGDNSGEQVPGYYGDITAYSQETEQMIYTRSLVTEYLSDKVQIGTSVTILPATYTGVKAEISYSRMPQYSKSLVEIALKKALLTDFSYNNVDIEDVITPEEIEFKLRQVEGVSNVRVTDLYREGGSGRNSLVGFSDEIFVFTEANILLTELATDAAITSASFAPKTDANASTGSATILPAFSATVYSYNVSLPSTTTRVTVGSGLHDPNASMTINDVAGTSSTVQLVTDAIQKVNTVIITATAEDGVTVKSYKFKVTIA